MSLYFAAHHHSPQGISVAPSEQMSTFVGTPNAFNKTVEKWLKKLNERQPIAAMQSRAEALADDKYSDDLKIRNHTKVLQHIMSQLDGDEEQAVTLVNIVMRILEAEYNKQNNSSINFIDAWTALEPVQNSKWLFFKQPKQDKILMELFSTKETDEDWPAPTLINHIVEIMMPSPQAAANANAKAAIAKRAAAWEDFKKGASNNSGQFNAYGGRRTRRNRRNRRSTRSRR